MRNEMWSVVKGGTYEDTPDDGSAAGRRDMRQFWIAGSVLFALIGCERAPVGDGVAFVNVNVVDVEQSRILSDQTVVVEGNRIVDVGPSSHQRQYLAGRLAGP